MPVEGKDVVMDIQRIRQALLSIPLEDLQTKLVFESAMRPSDLLHSAEPAMAAVMLPGDDATTFLVRLLTSRKRWDYSNDRAPAAPYLNVLIFVDRCRAIPDSQVIEYVRDTVYSWREKRAKGQVDEAQDGLVEKYMEFYERLSSGAPWEELDELSKTFDPLLPRTAMPLRPGRHTIIRSRPERGDSVAAEPRAKPWWQFWK